MGLHKFLMKHGAGSPGYIARKLADAYLSKRTQFPLLGERDILRCIFVDRIAAQSAFGGPPQYQLLKRTLGAIDELIDNHPDLYSIVLLSIFVELPRLMPPYTQRDTFETLKAAVQETLDNKTPGWRTGGVWSNSDLACSLCKGRIHHPDSGTMYAAMDEDGRVEYACAECA